MRKQKYDWPVIKAAFVEGVVDEKNNRTFPTMPALAKKFGVNYGVLRNRAARGKWAEEHDSFVTKVQEARQTKQEQDAEGIGAERAKSDGDWRKIGRAIRGRCAQLLHAGATPSELAAISQAAKNAQQIENLGFGDKPAPGFQINNLINVDLSMLSEDEIALSVKIGLLSAPQPYDS